METIEHSVTCGRSDSVAGYRSCSIADWQRDFDLFSSGRGGRNWRPLCFHYWEGVRESFLRCADNLPHAAFDLRPLGCCAGMGGASLLFRLRLGTAGCDGCLHAPRRTRGAVCRSLFWISYNVSLNKRSKKFAEWNAPLKYERKPHRNLADSTGLRFFSQKLLRTGTGMPITALLNRSDVHQNREEQLL